MVLFQCESNHLRSAVAVKSSKIDIGNSIRAICLQVLGCFSVGQVCLLIPGDPGIQNYQVHG